MKIPACYGWLHDSTNKHCAACMIQRRCATATIAPKERTAAAKVGVVAIPKGKDKRQLILAVCRKYGIPTVYIDRAKAEHTINDENAKEYFNLDFLLTSKSALEKLLQAEIQ